MINKEFPILEFDPNSPAVIDPQMVVAKVLDMPEHCVLCFFAEAIEKVLAKYEHRVVGRMKAESMVFPVYELTYGDQKIALVQAGVGAPLAVSQIDELTAMGASKYLVCGSCGVLRQEVAVGHLIIPDSAVRDEGASYHYVAPAREIQADPHAVACIQSVLARHDLPYIVAKTWTTDAFYRETRDKVERRKAEGCVTVEMEASAYMAAAQFRGVKLGQILYAGDNLGGEDWDSRSFYERTDVRAMLLDVTLEACLEL